MEYTIIVNGQSYDLPKKTLNIISELDTVLKIDSNEKLSIKQKYEKLHSFAKKVLGDDNVKEILGSDDLNEVDLSDLTILVKEIDNAYIKPISDYATQKAVDDINALPIDKIVELARLSDKLPQKAK